MAVPTFDQLLRPILELASKTEITRQSATAAMAREFSLTEEELQETIPSGGATKISNRTGWAMSHLTKGGLISKVAKFTYRVTEKGMDYLKDHAGPITPSDLKNIEGLIDAWNAASKKKASANRNFEEEYGNGAMGNRTTPEEMIDEAVRSIGDSLRDELLDHLSKVDPYRFEAIVIDLLFAMGYGGSRSEAAQVTKRSGDEGIDGIINEDRLGLDVIYVQAKRWKNTVGRPEIQSFVGALAGRQAQKGIFITSGSFAPSAIDYAATVSQKVILIDGMRLASLMIEHGVGVSISRSVELKRIDSDYFDEA